MKVSEDKFSLDVEVAKKDKQINLHSKVKERELPAIIFYDVLVNSREFANNGSVKLVKCRKEVQILSLFSFEGTKIFVNMTRPHNVSTKVFLVVATPV